jgi:diadenosine tetraphosphate (Ap4A) HIT family hydrolase
VRVDGCAFCEPAAEEILPRSELCYAIWTKDGPDGSAMVLPRAHRQTPFELTPDEWRATHELLAELRRIVDDRVQPDGYNIGWNVFEVAGQSIAHAHCHLIPRWADEPFAGRGLRWWFKQPENRRRR